LHLTTTIQPHFLHIFLIQNPRFGLEPAPETGTKPKPPPETPKTHHSSPQKPKLGFIHNEMV
jgi:hypothetical protein